MPYSNIYDAVIVGGGASGLAAALALAKPAWTQNTAAFKLLDGLDVAQHLSTLSIRPKVLILEGQDKLGAKILATGNGRCNFANINADYAAYHNSENIDLKPLFQTWKAKDSLQFFTNLGLKWKLESDRVYPYSYRASSLRDCLLRAVEAATIEFNLNEEVISISHMRSYYTIKTARASYHSKAIFLATGGLVQPSAKNLAGSGLRLCESFSKLKITKCQPAMVMLTFNKPYKRLAGLRTQARIDLKTLKGQLIETQTGEILFTDYGLSGIPVLSLAYAARAGMHRLHIDLFPELSQKELVAYLCSQAANFPQTKFKNFGLGIIDNKLAEAILAFCGYNKDDRRIDFELGKIKPEIWQKIAASLKDFNFTVSGNKDYLHAQTMHGGVSLNNIDPSNFQAKDYPNLYILGELLDVDGICGGFNLHFAWLSGCLSGLDYHLKLIRNSEQY